MGKWLWARIGDGFQIQALALLLFAIGTAAIGFLTHVPPVLYFPLAALATLLLAFAFKTLISLQDRLGKSSLVTATFDLSDPGCLRENTTITQTISMGLGVSTTIQTLCDWYRIKVETTGAREAHHCRGRLKQILRNGEAVVTGEPIEFPFAPATREDAYDRTIRDGAPEYLDFAFVAHGSGEIGLTGSHLPSSVDLREALSKYGTYQFDIAILSDGPTIYISPTLEKKKKGPSRR